MSLGRCIPETAITGWKNPVRGLQIQEAGTRELTQIRLPVSNMKLTRILAFLDKQTPKDILGAYLRMWAVLY